MTEQDAVPMSFDPAFGHPQPHPPTASQWRTFYGKMAWVYNPWTGEARHPADIGSDVMGHLIVPTRGG